MKLAQRVENISDSITLKLNEKATKLSESGKKVFNLTAGQLPFKPDGQFVSALEGELKFLKSFQYSPVQGNVELRDKFQRYFEKRREISFPEEYDTIISNGGKQSLYNALGAILNPEDEVILLAPYWVSYPEMIKLWGGVPRVVTSESYQMFLPSLDDLENTLSSKTKCIILNSPNNPSGICYPSKWMKELAEILKKYPDIYILSDEIYFELSYFDPRPRYFYEYAPELLKRTLIFEGISKSFAATGLRIGTCSGPKKIIKAMSAIQGQTSSGANSLVQQALLHFDFSRMQDFLAPIQLHLRTNANILRDKFREYNMGSSWYQTTSAFYYLLDFARTPYFQRNFSSALERGEDCAPEICEKLLEQNGLALVPGADFGVKNCARLGLVLEESAFEKAMTMLCQFLGDSIQ